MKKKSIIVLVIIFVIFIGALIGYNMSKSKDQLKPTTEIDPESVEWQPDIDFSNTANVKIEEDKKINISEEVLKDHTVAYQNYEEIGKEDEKGTLKLTDVSLYADKYQSHFSFTLNNDNDFDISYVSINIAFVDDDGNYLYSSERNITNLKAHTKVELGIDDHIDYSNAANIEIIVS